MRPFKLESNLDRWFKQNYQQFGYVEIVANPGVGKMKGYPDYYCFTETDGKTFVGEKVELELLSCNFWLHGHDPAQVNKVICCEDNCALYGVDKPPGLIELHIPVEPTVPHYRCRNKIQRIFAKGWERQLAACILWFRTDGYCCVCGKPVNDFVANGNLTASEIAKHRGCLPVVGHWLEAYLKGEKV